MCNDAIWESKYLHRKPKVKIYKIVVCLCQHTHGRTAIDTEKYDK